MLKPKSKKGEIGTIVMMALLVIVSLISFGSPNFLSKKQTISTKAATTCVIGGKCGSGKQWNCTTDNGCDPTGSCKIQDLEFACCVLNYKACSDGITNKYRWYGCTGQPCQNQTISQSNGPGYLVGCQSGVGPGNPDSCQIQLPTPTPTPSTPNTDNPASSSETCDDYGSANVCSENCDTYCKAGKISNSKKWCCSGGQTTNTPTPTRTPTPTIVNTPLPTSSGKICAIFTLDYKCYGIGKIFHPSQIVSVCPKNSSCWGIDTSSCDQTFEEVQKYFCSDQPPTPTGPTATTAPVPPTRMPTPTIDPSLNKCVETRCDYPYESVKIRSKCSQVNSNGQCIQVGFYDYSDNSCTNSKNKNDICGYPGSVSFKINAQINLNQNTIISSGSHKIYVYRNDIWDVKISTTETTSMNFPINIPLTIDNQHNPGTMSFYIKFCYHDINNDSICLNSETQKFPGGIDPVISLSITL